MAAGAACYQRGDWFEAHERWETVWRKSRGDDRRVIQALIQVAAALLHLEAERPRPATTLLRKALAKLEGAPAELDGVDVAAVTRRAREALAAVAGGSALR